MQLSVAGRRLAYGQRRGSGVGRLSLDFGPATPPRAMRVLTSDGVELVGSEWGDRSAQHTVVFLHGFCLSQRSWALHIASLVDRYGATIRIISYDHRGHGQSQAAPVGTYCIGQLADDLAAVMAQLHVEGRVTLVGHSMGAMVALSHVVSAPPATQPQGLVLVGGAAGRVTQRGLGRLLASPGVRLVCRMGCYPPASALRVVIGPVCAAVGRCLDGRSPRGALADVIAAALATTPIATVFGFLPAFRDYDEYRGLGLIHARTVVVSGAADVITPVAHSLDLAAGVPGAEHICVAGAGHMLAQQAFRSVEQAITQAMGIDEAEPSAVARPRRTVSSGQRQVARDVRIRPADCQTAAPMMRRGVAS